MDIGFLMFYLGSVAMSLIIMYLIIRSATKSEKRYRVDYAQAHLLAEIARKQGVDEETIQTILSWTK